MFINDLFENKKPKAQSVSEGGEPYQGDNVVVYDKQGAIVDKLPVGVAAKKYRLKQKGIRSQLQAQDFTTMQSPEGPVTVGRPIANESLRDGEYYTWTVYFDDGTSQKINVASSEFDVRKHFAKQGKNVVDVDRSWAIHGGDFVMPRRATAGDDQERQDRNMQAMRRFDKSISEAPEDLIGFSVQTEQAYQAVMDRYGDYIEHHKDGIMYAPERLWGRIQEVAYDADGIGAEEDNGFEDLDNPYANNEQGVAEGLNLPPNIVEMIKKISQSSATPEHKKAAIDALISKYQEKGVSEVSNKLQGTPVVSLSDFDEKDTKKDRYGRTVPKKLKKHDPRVKFHKEPKKQGVDEEHQPVPQRPEISIEQRIARMEVQGYDPEQMAHRLGISTGEVISILRDLHNDTDVAEAEERTQTAYEIQFADGKTDTMYAKHDPKSEPSAGEVATMARLNHPGRKIKGINKTGRAFVKVTNEDVDRYVEDLNRAGYEVTEAKTRLDPKCWKGYRKAGTKVKGGVRVNNCVPVKKK